MNRRALLFVIGCAAFFFGTLARANVIFDVVVSYRPAYLFTFSMEFTDSVGTKDVDDLVGGDFQDEKLDGLPPFFDAAPLALNFSPDTLRFAAFISQDIFVVSAICDAAEFQFLQALLFDGCADADQFQVRVSERDAVTVPAPAILTLLIAGLPGLWLSRQMRGRRAARRFGGRS